MTDGQLEIIASKLAEHLFAQPRWLKLKAAAMYSSIGQKELIRLAQDHKIDGFQDTENGSRPWIFDRLSIDKYRSKQMASFSDPDEDERIALDIVRSLKI